MNKIPTIVLTILFSAQLSAQGNNLQFNQAFNYEYSQLCSLEDQLYTAGNITVPQNKVWKITHSSVYNSDTYSYSGSLLIDNIKVTAGRLASSSANELSNGIIWIKSGNYTVYLVSTSTSNQTIISTISGIEFNITP